MTKTPENIRHTIVSALRAQLQRPAEISGSTNIVRDLGLDSLAIMNFILELEDEFDISMPLDRIAGIETVDDLAGVVESILKQRRV